MKKILVLISILLVFGFSQDRAVFAQSDSIVRTTAHISLEHYTLEVPVYKINNSNYFKLRDFAELMRGEMGQFNVYYDDKSDLIEIKPFQPYLYTNYYLYYPKSTFFSAYASNSKIKINGQIKTMNTYVIDDYTYFKLRDLGALLNYEIGYDVDKKMVIIQFPNIPNVTQLPFFEGNMQSVKKDTHNYYPDGHSEFFIANPDGTKTILEKMEYATPISNSQSPKYTYDYALYNGQSPKYTYDYALYATLLDKDHTFIGEKEIELELPLFGSFYSGAKYNYIAFGQDNRELANKEVIRIVKYDKNFNKISHASVYGDEAYTSIPFKATSGGHMAEYGNKLVFHTARQRYDSHQSQLTIEIDTNTMRVTNKLGQFQENHVGHSFEQFALMDNASGHPVYLDLGDARPRAIVINNMKYGEKDREIPVMNIVGATGANQTYVSLGGFEQSKSHYLVAFNAHNQATVNDKNGWNQLSRNIYISAVDKSSTTSDARIVETMLADYEKTTIQVTTPTLVKVNDNRFLVMWQEFQTENKEWLPIKYVYLDHSGKQIGKVQTLHPFFRLSTAQPLVIDNKVIWTAVSEKHRYVYEMNVN